jgi:selenocysteine-specific elongation factor
MYVIGTAGHIDHGKSALIQKLTGIDPDRLREEKQRGMTIDLGFAWLKLPGGNEVGIIDVPGHEKFIKNMLAGVGAIDLALLVIAANESVMPQTREHLDILNLLGIDRGIVVITKKDLVNDEMLTLVRMEIEETVKDTFLQNAPILEVSAVTEEGLDKLVDTIENLLNTIEPARNLSKPRLFIDRVFSIAGAGTVVTGTLVDGELSVGEEVQILPTDLKARIRGLQMHKKKLEKIGPGSRTAVNLVNISPDQLERGNVIVRPGWLIPTDRFDVRLEILKSAGKPLYHGSIVTLFTGSTETPAKLYLLDKIKIEPGESGLAQFSVEMPVMILKGDHYIIRSSVDTIGGGTIIFPHARRHRHNRKEIVQRLNMMESSNISDIIISFLEFKQPARLNRLLVECNLTEAEVKTSLASLIAERKIVTIGQGENSLLYTTTGWESLVQKAQEIVKNYHKKYPARSGISKGELNSKLGFESNSPSLRKLFDDGILIEDSATVRMPSHKIEFTGKQMEEINSYMEQLNRNPYSPQVDIVLDRDIINQLIEQQKIVKVGDGVIFSRTAYEEMVNKIMEKIKVDGKITLAEVRDIFNTSRKYAKGLLEYLDEKKITRRVGDERVLR